MSRRKSKKDWSGANEELWGFIYDNGLENDVIQFSEYHHRIKNKIDVWSASKKYFVLGTSGSHKFNNFKELLEVINII